MSNITKPVEIVVDAAKEIGKPKNYMKFLYFALITLVVSIGLKWVMDKFRLGGKYKMEIMYVVTGIVSIAIAKQIKLVSF